MAARRNSGKLTVKPAEKVHPAPVVALDGMDGADFPDAIHYINSLSAQRDGIEWDIRVYQLTGGMGRGQTNKPLFLFNVQLEDLPQLESNLAEQFPAGGSFRVHVRADNQLVKNSAIEIAPRPGYTPPRPSYLAPVQTVETQPVQGDRMETMFLRMAEMQERSQQQTRDLIAALAANNRPAPQPTMMEQLELFSRMQALMPKGAQENTMDIFQKGMDLAMKMSEAAGGGGSGTNWMDLAREALNSPVIKEMLAGAAQAGQDAIAAAPAPAIAGPQNFPPAEPQNDDMVAQAVDTLLRQAAAGVDPKFVASHVWERVPAAFMTELEQQDDQVGYFIARFPQAAPHRAWLAALVAELWEDEQDAAPPSPTLNPDEKVTRIPQA